ncbi:MAG: hypothetical protein ABIH01_01680 [Candidatus Omnitrophota bacterium]
MSYDDAAGYLRIKSLLRCAQILEALGRWSEAKNIYQKLSEEQFDEAKYAKERLEWIKNRIRD